MSEVIPMMHVVHQSATEVPQDKRNHGDEDHLNCLSHG